ncbi:MAG: hypothetical protein COV66_07505 [Nitrospinae bacterium CG11_big_fil_rev_8_21_14_0_20_45_15]|nr:MAG: hypothetical protein COV66_07505 [Nitrospinae bacterium CG11_big_fil_rev_8_21_14_0_20_45_15]
MVGFFAKKLLLLLVLTLGLFGPAPCWSAGIDDIGPRDGYIAPQWQVPDKPKSRLKLRDNGDDTVTDLKTGLTWARTDSYADLKHCLNFYDSLQYVENSTTGGYEDWRLPSIAELASIYDNAIDNIMAFDHDPESPMSLHSIFTDGAAYWYWSSDFSKTKLTDCCGRTFYFVNGMSHIRRFTVCRHGGVRAVRGPNPMEPGE